MSAVRYIAVAFLVTACHEPAPKRSGECDAQCQERRERDIRFGNVDYVVESPGFWRFYDDFASRLSRPPECGTGPEGFGQLKPLWRRTMPAFPSFTHRLVESRNSLSVARGRVAVSLAMLMWVLDADSGTPLHAWQGDRDFEEEFAALSGGDMLWGWTSSGPVLIDILNVDRDWGPQIPFSWRRHMPRDGGSIVIDLGIYPQPAIGPDGTLYWTSQTGQTRAMSTSRHVVFEPKLFGRWETWARNEALGPVQPVEQHLVAHFRAEAHIKWEKNLGGGPRVVDEEGTVYLNGPGAAVRPDSSFKWRAEPLPQFDAGYGSALEVERPAKRSYWPVVWFNGSSIGNTYLAAHSLQDGSIIWHQRVDGLNVTSSSSTRSLSAQGPDGTLYVTSSRTSPLGEPTVGSVRAFAGDTGAALWQVDMPQAEGFDGSIGVRPDSDILGGPVPSPDGDGVYVASQNCKLYHVARDGGIDAWYQLAGRPIGHTPQLVDGVLYLVVSAPAPTDPNVEGREPCVPEIQSVSARVAAAKRYDCFAPMFCGRCLGDRLNYVYAFRVGAPGQ